MKNRRAPARRREQLGSGARARETTAGHLDASDPQAQPDVGPARVGARPGALTPRDVLRLQRTLGNRALNRLRQEPALPLPAAPVRRPLFGQAPTYAPRPARALQRIVVTQIVPGAGDLIGDVFVADAFGNLNAGGVVGDNLAYYIWKTTGAGFVIDGAIRDLNGIVPTGMGGYYRAAVPEAIREVMVAGINVPVRIGKVTVLPGDVVLGDREGVFFIPPHLVQDIIDEAEITHVHDEWTKRKFDEGKYKSSEIYGRPSDPALIKEYEEYLKQHVEPRIWQRYQGQRQAPGPQRKKQ